jgi:hypothetical protein
VVISLFGPAASPFFCIALDALGSTAFMRAVRAFERPQMTAVYRTYLDLSELLPLVFSIVLAFFGLGSIFVTLSRRFLGICGFFSWRYCRMRFASREV